jgi:hypothetical protein
MIVECQLGFTNERNGLYTAYLFVCTLKPYIKGKKPMTKSSVETTKITSSWQTHVALLQGPSVEGDTSRLEKQKRVVYQLV